MLFSASLFDWLGYFDTLPKPIAKSNLWGWSQEGLVSIKGYGPSTTQPDSKLVPKMGNHPAADAYIVTLGRWPIVVITTSRGHKNLFSLNKCMHNMSLQHWFETPNWEGILCQTHFVCSLIQNSLLRGAFTSTWLNYFRIHSSKRQLGLVNRNNCSALPVIDNLDRQLNQLILD